MSDRSSESPQADPWGVVPQRLRPPVLRGDVLPRSALVDRLLSSEERCVAIQAGAGYGKTTLLSQWTEADDRAVAWVGLDPSDNDPVILVRHIVRSLADSGQAVSGVEELLAGRELQLDRQVLPALAQALDQPDQPYLVALDDVHVLTDDTSLHVVDRLLDMATPGSAVALAGRSIPPLHLARRRLDGVLLDLRQGELAFTDDEAVELLRRSAPELSATAVGELVRRTEHWPAGLYLGVLAIRDHPDPPVLIRGMLSEDRRVVDYLHEEVLDRVTPEVREFLLRAAVLDRLSGDLCDAVLERRDSRALLQELTESGNLFVVGIESDTDAFRLHHLFAELLVSALRREDPEELLRIRRRAAVWHDEHSESDLAVRQAVATGDIEFATTILYRQLFPTMVMGRTASMERWIAKFPPQELHSNGLLAVCAAWQALTRGDRTQLNRHLGTARSAPVVGALPDGTVGYGVALASLEMTAAVDGVKASAESAALVRAAGPTGSPWWGMAGLIEAVSLVVAGAADPVDAFGSAELDARGLPAIHAVTLAHLGLAHLQRGDRARGQKLVRDAVEELEANRLEHYAMATMVHCADSYASALRGDRTGSRAASERAVALLEVTTGVVPRAAVHMHLVLADAALHRRDPVEAAPLLRAATVLLPQEPDAVVLHDWADGLQVRLSQQRRQPDLPELSAAERRVLEQLPTHRSLGEVGDHLCVSRNTVKTHTLSIYRKLFVSGRSEAVDRARELGLLTSTDPG